MNQQDFLFELGCEELPPKALPKLAQSLHDHVMASLESLQLNFLSSDWFATPRRIAIRFTQLDIAQKDQQVEKLGPAVAAAFDNDGNAKPAALGFAKSCGVSIDQISRKQTDKGERLAFIAEVKGEKTETLLPELLTKAIAQLPVPKNMRWGDPQIQPEAQFSRPVHWILALLGEKIVPINLFNIDSSNQTFGHRFHAPQAIKISNPKEYESQLEESKVIVSFQARKAKIRIQVEAIAKQKNAIAVIDEDLLEEVCALVEWPVALLGDFDEAFLSVPAEALVSSMAEHQKYFHLVDQNNKLMANFITVSNIQSKNPDSVIQGNEKVIRPRLADAKFFYDTDKKVTLASQIDKLKSIVFQNQLGTIYDKTQRVKILSQSIAKEINADQALVMRSAELYKCDLVTNMVGEFSDLQGIMGRYYAINDAEPAEVCAAMDEVYMPRFSGDQLPETQTGLILAIAERIDTLVGIFGIGQIPSGTKDPFALRRSCVGVLRLITDKKLSLDLSELIKASLQTFKDIQLEQNTESNLLDYFSARTLAMYQEGGIATQVIRSVQELKVTQPLDFKNRLDAINHFNQTSESQDLAEANKRVKNILQKSDFNAEEVEINPELFGDDEKALFIQINKLKDIVDSQVSQGEYGSALEELASIKDVVNVFFDNVMINVEDLIIKNNRLALITQLRNLFMGIADISLLQK